MMELSRYIILNPIRAGLVQDPASWPWSSYRDLDSGIGIADHELILSLFSNNHDSARAQYLEFICEGLDASFPWDEIRDYLDGKKESPRPGLEEIFGEGEHRNDHIAEAYSLYGYKLREIAEFLNLSIAYVHRVVRAHTKQQGEING